MSSPIGAAARKNPPPASLVAHRSFAIPAVTSTSRTTVSRPRTPVAIRTPSARQERKATSTPVVSGRRTSPSAGSIRRRSPATTSRSLQTASTTATTSLVGELDTHPSCTSDSKSVRSVPADVSIITTRARYQALSPGSSDAIATMQSSSHQAASQMLRSARHAGRSSRRPSRGSSAGGGCGRRPRRTPPRGSRGAGRPTGRSRPNPPRPTARPRVRRRRPGRRSRPGDHAWSSATPSTVGSGLASPIASTSRAYSWWCALRRPVRSERQRPAVGRPAGLVVVARTVRDLAQPRTRRSPPGRSCRRGALPAVPIGHPGTRSSVPSGEGRGSDTSERSAEPRSQGPAVEVLDVACRAGCRGGLVPARDCGHGSATPWAKDRRDRVSERVTRPHYTWVRGHRATRHPRRP